MKLHLSRFLRVLAALFVLLAITSWAAFLPLGGWNWLVSLSISFSMTALIALFFMRVKYSEPLIALTLLAGPIWLSLLLLLMLLDYATRVWPR